MDEIRSKEDFEKVKAFKELIESTISGLKGVSMPSQFVAVIEEHLPRWNEHDSEFAELLRSLKGQAWSMETMHIREACSSIIAHLEKNLAEVKKLLPR